MPIRVFVAVGLVERNSIYEYICVSQRSDPHGGPRTEQAEGSGGDHPLGGRRVQPRVFDRVHLRPAGRLQLASRPPAERAAAAVGACFCAVQPRQRVAVALGALGPYPAPAAGDAQARPVHGPRPTRPAEGHRGAGDHRGAGGRRGAACLLIPPIAIILPFALP